MIKVLIVEDEKIERDSLQSMVEEMKPAVSEVITAENGEQGFEQFLKHRPELVLTDIYMPKVDGLAMLERIRIVDQDVICFILTSYDYFKYAQKAIQLKVEDFILKPADSKTIKQSIYRGIQILEEKEKESENDWQKKISQAEKVLENECFYSIMMKHDGNRIKESLQFFGVNAVSGYCAVFSRNQQSYASFGELKRILKLKNYQCISGTMQNEDVLFVLSEKQLTSADQEIIGKTISIFQLPLKDYSIGMITHQLSRLVDSYQDALYQKRLSIDLSQMEINEIRDLVLEYAVKCCSQLEDNLYSQSIRDFSLKLSMFNSEKVDKALDVFFRHLMIEVNKHFNVKLDTEEVLYRKESYYNDMIVEKILLNCLEKIRKVVLDERYKNSSYLMKKGISYIEKNYKKVISLNDVAEYLNVSTFYISKVFSKEGYNFTEIVNDMRIKEAKRLIKKGYAFKQIAYEVGYGSQSYFAKIFKKKVGCSPREYRNMN